MPLAALVRAHNHKLLASTFLNQHPVKNVSIPNRLAQLPGLHGDDDGSGRGILQWPVLGP